MGRDDEMRGLLAVVARPSSCVLIQGSAGMGKSRLLAELAEDSPSLVFIGRCWQSADAAPFRPWVQICGQTSKILDPTSAEVHGRDDLGPVFPQLSPETRFKGRAARQLLHLAVTEYLTSLAATAVHPPLLIFDDLHRADSDSLRLLNWVIRQPTGVAIVATIRPPDDAPPDTTERLRAVAEAAEPLHLRPLGPVAVRDALRGSAVEDDFDIAMAATRGIPLLIRDYLYASGTSSESIIHLTDNQMGALPESSSSALRYAALLGDEFDLGTLGELVGMPPSELIATLDHARQFGLVEPAGASLATWRFHHEAHRSRIEAGIGAEDMARHHQLILHALIRRFGRGPQMLPRLAEHASRAAFVGDADLAVELNLEAAEEARREGAPGAAAKLFGRALDLAMLGPQSIEQRLEIRMDLAAARRLMDDVDNNDEIIAVLEDAERCGHAATITHGALLLTTHRAGTGGATEQDVITTRWLRRALNVIGDAPTAQRARLVSELAVELQDQLENLEAAQLFDEALTIAAELEDVSLAGWVTAVRHTVRRFPNDADDVLKELAEAEHGLPVGDHETRFAIMGARIVSLLRVGRAQEAKAEIARVEQDFAPAPTLISWSIARWKAALSVAEGDLERGERLANEAFETAQGTPLEARAVENLGFVAGAAMRDRLQTYAAVEITSVWVDRHPEFLPYRSTHAWVLSDLGRNTEAEEAILPAFVGDTLDRPWVVAGLPVLNVCGLTAANVRRQDWCALIVKQLGPYADEWIIVGSAGVIEGPAAITLAGCQRVLGNTTEAATLLDRAEAMISAAGWDAWYPQLHRNRALLALEEGDGARAADQYLLAAASAERQGLTEASEALKFSSAVAAASGARLENGVREVVGAVPAQPTDRSRVAVLERVGTSWRVSLDGTSVVVRHLKGLSMLAALVAAPNREIHVTELSAIGNDSANGLGSAKSHELEVGGTAGDPILDRRALAAYRDRLEELREIQEEAEANSDSARASIARDEFEFIVSELAASTGLGGRSRDLDKTVERARVRVTKSIRAAISRIDPLLPLLGAHLHASVRTGTFCGYHPDPGVEISWQIDANRPH